MRLHPLVLAAVTIGLLAGCGDDRPADAGPADGPSDRPATEWTASPGQLDKVTAALTSRRFTCSDLAEEGFTWRVCTGQRRQQDSGGSYLVAETAKLVAAQDGTVVRFALDASDSGSKSLVAAVGPLILGPSDTAILQADGTTLQWGSVGEQEVDGFEDALVGTISGLRRPPSPPSGRLPVTKEQVLLALTKSPSLKCRIDDGMSTPEPKELGQVDVGPTLDCKDKTLGEDTTRRRAGVELADDGGGVSEVELTASHESRKIVGTLVMTRLQPVWAALGPDLDEVRQAVGRYLEAGVETTGYAGGWKIIVDNDTTASGGDSDETPAPAVRVRILRERPDLADPWEPR
jgi:hypothetical protein